MAKWCEELLRLELGGSRRGCEWLRDGVKSPNLGMVRCPGSAPAGPEGREREVGGEGMVRRSGRHNATT
eukprot:scaffold21274_cov79-Isochrysis_galbana.AAC.1